MAKEWDNIADEMVYRRAMAEKKCRIAACKANAKASADTKVPGKTYDDLLAMGYSQLVEFKHKNPAEYNRITETKPTREDLIRAENTLRNEFTSALLGMKTDAGHAITDFKRKHPEEYARFMAEPLK